MATTENELVTTLQHTLATAWQGQLQWVKTLQGAGIPTNSQGLLLRFTDGSTFQFLILRTKRAKTDPGNSKSRTLNLVIPEESHDNAEV